MTGRYYKEAIADGTEVIRINKTANVGKSISSDSTSLRTINNLRVVEAIAKHMAEIRRAKDGRPETMVDARGRVWKAGNSEGVPTWVSTDPYESPYSWNLPMPQLKKIVIAVRVAIFRG